MSFLYSFLQNPDMKKRQFYIDNLRILLTCLVVLHHLAIAYGGPGLWYYNEANSNEIATILLALFVATNQSFFMGMFFMISAYFLEKSLRRKSESHVFFDKLKRMGIPLAFYALVLSPIIMYLLARFDKGLEMSISDFFQNEKWLTFGPLWFIAALLLFTFVTLLLHNSKKENNDSTQRPLPSNGKIFGLAISIALISFVVRIWFPVGWSLKPFGFQFAHFPQYIILFYFGWIASENNWFDKISFQQSKRWGWMVLFFVFVLFPVVFALGGALEGKTEIFMGSLSWQSFIFSIWEQLVGIGMMIMFLGFFKEKYNSQGDKLKAASASAYTVFIIHALILVAISLAIKDWEIGSSLKFLMLAPIVLIVCFVLANFLRKLPYLRKIL